MAILPTAKALYLCEEVDVESGALNLYALLDTLRPHGYPHTQPSFVCFAQLLGGLGIVPCHVDVRRADDYSLVYNTSVYRIDFPDRRSLRHLALEIEGCVFDSPGVYLVELYCDNTWIADTALQLQEIDP